MSHDSKSEDQAESAPARRQKPWDRWPLAIAIAVLAVATFVVLFWIVLLLLSDH
jgi:hypothetical protein